jgi:hypothetical protein
MAWRQVKAMVIEKPRKSDCPEANTYRPISLPPFLLVTVEKKVVSLHGLSTASQKDG